MTRRGFLLTPLALAAQSSRPRVSLVWDAAEIPDSFAREAVVFPRAYTCCPNRAEAISALEHGRFPHAASSNDASLWDYFERASTDTANTITVMTSHSADGNDSHFERSIHVPLAIRWPGRLTPRVANETLFSHVDVLSTLLGMAGIAPSPVLQHDAVYIEGGLGTRDEWRALVRGFDKLTWNLRDEITGLYNLANDPGEETDLRDQREHRLTRDFMFALGHQWMERLQDGRDTFGLRTRRPL